MRRIRKGQLLENFIVLEPSIPYPAQDQDDSPQRSVEFNRYLMSLGGQLVYAERDTMRRHLEHGSYRKSIRPLVRVRAGVS